MKSFEYGDQEIGGKEAGYAVSNVVIGLGILTLPSSVVLATDSSDGWMSILIGGGLAAGAVWVICRLLVRFPKRNYRDIAAAITNVPIANTLALLFALYAFLFTSYELRGLTSVAKLYLFDKTPAEPICLSFLLILVYGVAGPSIALLRLNLLYLPIILFIVLFVLLMSMGSFNYHQLKPMFVTPWRDVLKASKETIFSFLGFEVLLYYNIYLNQPRKLVKPALIGMIPPLALYLAVFLFVVATFSSPVVANTLYPVAELAKQVEVPGGFFERFESLFFVIWVISLFTTAAMVLDMTVLAIQSVFRRAGRQAVVLTLAPLLFLVAMQPRNIHEIRKLSEWVSYMGIVIAWFFPACLLVIAKLRGVKARG